MISDGIGTKFYIGGIVTTDDASTLVTGQTWTEVKKVEAIPEFGPSRAGITFTALDGKVIKRGGAEDAGDLAITAGNLPEDPGQLLMNAAQKTKFKYGFKIEAADAPDEDGTPSAFYLIGMVNSNRTNVGQSNAVNKRSWALPLDDVHEVPAAAGG